MFRSSDAFIRESSEKPQNLSRGCGHPRSDSARSWWWFQDAPGQCGSRSGRADPAAISVMARRHLASQPRNFPARGGVEAGFRRGACAESKAAWRFASRRTPKCARRSTRADTIPQLVGGCAKHVPATSSAASSGAKTSSKRSGRCDPFRRCTRRGCRSATTATAKKIRRLAYFIRVHPCSSVVTLDDRVVSVRLWKNRDGYRYFQRRRRVRCGQAWRARFPFQVSTGVAPQLFAGANPESQFDTLCLCWPICSSSSASCWVISRYAFPLAGKSLSIVFAIMRRWACCLSASKISKRWATS